MVKNHNLVEQVSCCFSRYWACNRRSCATRIVIPAVLHQSYTCIYTVLSHFSWTKSTNLCTTHNSQDGLHQYEDTWNYCLCTTSVSISLCLTFKEEWEDLSAVVKAVVLAVSVLLSYKGHWLHLVTVLSPCSARNTVFSTLIFLEGSPFTKVWAQNRRVLKLNQNSFHFFSTGSIKLIVMGNSQTPVQENWVWWY